MKASELIQKLQEAMGEHGDLDVVSGVAVTGYGEPVRGIARKTGQTLQGEEIAVLDLVLSDESLVAVGGF